MDRLLGDEQQPMSRHRYLYAYDDVVNRIDPSGLATMFQGMRVHAEIGIDFLRGQHFGERRDSCGRTETVACRMSNLSISTILDEVGFSKRRPDLTDRCTFEVYEIKPFGSESLGEIQLGQYEDLLLGENRPGRWHPGTTYKPIDWVWIMWPVIGAEVYGPDNGIITYRVREAKSPNGAPVGQSVFSAATSVMMTMVNIVAGIFI